MGYAGTKYDWSANKMKNIALLFIIILTFSLVSAQDTSSQVLVLRHANLIDGISTEPIKGVTVTIRENRIISIEKGDPNFPAGAMVLDLNGRWLLPGYVDAHAHLSDLRTGRNALATGVTTARNMNCSHFVDTGIRGLNHSGFADLPDVLAAGYQIRPDLPEDFFLNFPQLSDLMPKLAGVANVRRVVRANLSRGVNLIKVLATERGGTPNTDPRKRTFSDEELIAIVEEAKVGGVFVAAHAHGDEGAAAAVRAGVRSIEHGSFLSDETLRLMKARGTYLVTTMALFDFINPAAFQNMPWMVERNKEVTAAAPTVALRAYKMGIPLVGGTDYEYKSDSPIMRPGLNVTHEAAAIVKAGIPPLDAIKAITSRSAECLGIAQRTGTIKQGLEADLVVIERDPTTDITALKEILLVINNGKVAINKMGK